MKSNHTYLSLYNICIYVESKPTLSSLIFSSRISSIHQIPSVYMHSDTHTHTPIYVWLCMNKMLIHHIYLSIYIYTHICTPACICCVPCIDASILCPMSIGHAPLAPRLRTGVMALLGCSSATSVAYLARLDRQMVSDGLAGRVEMERDSKMDCDPVLLIWNHRTIYDTHTYTYIHIYIYIYI